MKQRRTLLATLTIVALLCTVPGSLALANKTDERAKQRAAKLEKKRQKELKKLRKLKRNEFYIIGKIEILPKIRRNEQRLETISSDRLRNKVYGFYSNQVVDMANLGMGAGKHAVLVDLNSNFIAKRRKTDKLFYSGGMVWMNSTARHSGHMNSKTTIYTGQLYLPGGMVYNIKQGDQAVYVGTLRYTRDKHNRIKSVKYINDFKRASAHFYRVIGNQSIKVRLAKPRKAPRT